jgi:hypothetical protein
VGPLQSGAGLSLNTIFGGTVIFALLMSALAFVLAPPAALSPESQVKSLETI